MLRSVLILSPTALIPQVCHGKFSNLIWCSVQKNVVFISVCVCLFKYSMSSSTKQAQILHKDSTLKAHNYFSTHTALCVKLFTVKK